MTYSEFKKAAFDSAVSLGAKAAECVYSESNRFRVNILDGEVDSYSVSKSCGFGLRVDFDGKNGYAYTEDMSDPQELAERAVDNARVIENEDLSPMQGPQEYTDVVSPAQPLCDLKDEERIELARKLEKAALAADPLIKRVQTTSVSASEYKLNISNTLGLDAKRQGRIGIIYTVPIAMREGESVPRDGVAYRFGESALEIDDCAKEAAQEAVMMLGAAPAPSGPYRILLRNNAACDLFEAFSGIFSAESAQKNLSPLTNREGEILAAQCVSIVDDPLDKRDPRPFDDEGTPSCATTLIDNGKFKGFLHNLKTAYKAGTVSTSNAYRASAALPVGISPSNFILVPGDDSFDSLVSELESGLIITDISGLHAGLNPISGDFSLLASGLLVEKGQVVRPVDRITVAGNFLTLLKDIVKCGSDTRISPSSGGFFALPSLLIRELMVAGE